MVKCNFELTEERINEFTGKMNEAIFYRLTNAPTIPRH